MQAIYTPGPNLKKKKSKPTNPTSKQKTNSTINVPFAGKIPSIYLYWNKFFF